jgi:hypothetical protein
MRAQKYYQKEIEALLKGGLKDETDYSNLESLYQLSKLPEQAKFIASVKKEKFPSGVWTVGDALNKFYAEKDIEKKKQLLADLLKQAENGGDTWKNVRTNSGTYKMQIAYALCG